MIAISNEIRLAPEHLKIEWGVDGVVVASAIDDVVEEPDTDDELLEPVSIVALAKPEPAKARDHTLLNYKKYDTMYVEGEKLLDPDFKEEKPKFAKRAATALLKKFAESKTFREEGNRCAKRGDFGKACDQYQKAIDLCKFSMDWNATEVRTGPREPASSPRREGVALVGPGGAQVLPPGDREQGVRVSASRVSLSAQWHR